MSAMATTWRCVECGSLFAEHFPLCTSCWRTGALLPMGNRLRAAIDYQPGVSNARALAGMAWMKVEHAGAYDDLVVGAGGSSLSPVHRAAASRAGRAASRTRSRGRSSTSRPRRAWWGGFVAGVGGGAFGAAKLAALLVL